MATEVKTYLATQIISEQNTISYRNVARALKVHVNAAKCMLYEYHKDQNQKKPGSIYATYMVAGMKKTPQLTETNGKSNGVTHHDEDEPMPSSPPPFTSSMLEPSQQESETEKAIKAIVPVKTVTLVREEALEAMKQQYDSISSIHVYSLSPSKLPDLVTLIDIGRGLYTDVFAKEDPLIHNKTYGVIQNPDVRRRKGKRPNIPDGPVPKFQPVKTETKATNKPPATSATKATTSVASLKREDSDRPSSRDSTSTKDSNKPSLKRDASDLFKAFAKGKKPAPKEVQSVEDAPMADANEEGESEDEALFLDTNTRSSGTKKRSSDVKKEREDKAAKLRKMMDSDDEDAVTLPTATDGAGVVENDPEDTEKPDEQKEKEARGIENVDWSDSDTETQRKNAVGKDQSKNQEGEQIETNATAASAAAEPPKRRRGKRKAVKKRTMKDEDGYLVTKEEEVWESYSEDEPPEQNKTKTKPAFGAGMKNTASSQTKTPAGKAGAAGGVKKGGNIMNFFGKK